MSREQWGHGYRTGLKAKEKVEEKFKKFPVGFFFAVPDTNGKIEKQGKVISCSDARIFVKFFNWIDGEISKQIFPINKTDASNWKWYETDEQMRDDIDRINGYS